MRDINFNHFYLGSSPTYNLVNCMRRVYKIYRKYCKSSIKTPGGRAYLFQTHLRGGGRGGDI